MPIIAFLGTWLPIIMKVLGPASEILGIVTKAQSEGRDYFTPEETARVNELMKSADDKLSERIEAARNKLISAT
jgi:hypothetical protein